MSISRTLNKSLLAVFAAVVILAVNVTTLHAGGFEKALVGAAAGALIGNAVDGSDGAAKGAAIGAGVGLVAEIAENVDDRRRSYHRDRVHHHGHHGHKKHKKKKRKKKKKKDKMKR